MGDFIVTGKGHVLRCNVPNHQLHDIAIITDHDSVGSGESSIADDGNVIFHTQPGM